MEFKSIFTPLKIGNMVLKNRLVIPGMGNNLGSEDGAGDMTPKAQAYYAERAKGGYGRGCPCNRGRQFHTTGN